MTALNFAFDQVDLFAEVYLPVKTPTATGLPEDYTYENIGLMPDEIASIYAEYFGANFLVEDFTTPSVAANRLARRIQAVIHMNKAKYLKNIELQGYAWNPLWNVDGTEVETYTSNRSDTINEKYGKGTTMTSTGSTSETIDETYGKGTTMTATESKDTTVSDHESSTQTTKHAGQTSDYTDTTSFDYHGAVIDPSNPSSGEEGSRKYIPKDRTITDRSKETETLSDSKSGGSTTNDTGNSSEVWSGNDTKKGSNSGTDNRSDVWSGEDSKSGTNTSTDEHTLTKERHGNIGVTKTTELIDSARETLKWSILMDFFDDINEQILIGIY